MAAEKLVIEIRLGNEAMKGGPDVGAKLDQLGDLFTGFGELLFPGEREILDRNGNRVGFWKMT